MDAVPVTIALQRLFCYHGSDSESDSEPYLWAVGFTIDGRTVTHTPDAPTLTGGPAFFYSAGSHDNIGGSMGIGSTRTIPPAVGRFDTTLQPIVLTVGGQVVEVPGTLGMIAILLEEDSTSDVGSTAAHNAINNLVTVEMNEAVADINLAGLGAQVLQAVSEGRDPAQEARTVFTARMQRLVDRIQRYARSVAIDAIVSNLSGLGAIPEGADPDEFLGVGVHIYTEVDLAATQHDEWLEFTDTIAQPGVAHLESSDYVFNLHGAVWRRVEDYSTPITDQVPPGRWQVTGVSRSGRAPGKTFISSLGGQFTDGSPWLLAKGQVMDFLVAGSHSFFVRGSSGVEADVKIEPEPLNPYFPSLTTTADSDLTNNLGSLPQCPVAIWHTRPVD